MSLIAVRSLPVPGGFRTRSAASAAACAPIPTLQRQRGRFTLTRAAGGSAAPEEEQANVQLKAKAKAKAEYLKVEEQEEERQYLYAWIRDVALAMLRLELCGTALPPRSLRLLVDLRHLEELVVDVCDVTDEALREAVEYWWEATAWVDALGALFARAPALGRVTVTGVGWRADVRGVREQVAEWLTGTGRERAVVLEVS